jgi:hypothetical protein
MACSSVSASMPQISVRFCRSACSDFVGYYPETNSVIVAHEGTNPIELYVLVPLLFWCELSYVLTEPLPSQPLGFHGHRRGHGPP